MGGDAVLWWRLKTEGERLQKEERVRYLGSVGVVW